jgi:hypothetical protein
MVNRRLKLWVLGICAVFTTAHDICFPYNREYCNYRGTCSPTGDGCVCDDYLHYWPSERCETWHDGRELEPGMYCYPETVDQYCSWMGICSSDGNTCECFDSAHRTSSDRCSSWNPEPTVASTLSPTLQPSSLDNNMICSPYDREYCNYRGTCSPSGDACVCDDYLHYWPSERCKTWHDGRELELGFCCYPNTVDQYCSWMGTCNSDGTSCECFESQHRSPLDRCLHWYEVKPEIPDPISSPSSLQLSSVDFNQSCLLVTLIDTFGDHWGSDVSFSYSIIYENLTSTTVDVEGSLTVQGGRESPILKGCLPKLSYSHDFILQINSPLLAPWYWEVQWSLEFSSNSSDLMKYFGGIDTSFQFHYEATSDEYYLVYFEEVWVYPEESPICANLNSDNFHSNCSVFQFNYFGLPSLSNSSMSFGNNYQDAGWYISDLNGTDIFDFGIPWSFSSSHENNLTSLNHCLPCLADGEYLLRVTGVNYLLQNQIAWTFCNTAGTASTQLHFSIFGGVCTPHLPLLTLKDLVFAETCPSLSTPSLAPSSPPTPHSSSSSSPTILVPIPTPYPTHPTFLTPSSVPSINSNDPSSTFAPSAQVTSMPSSSISSLTPSVQVTSLPSSAPTSQPSLIPSYQPSYQPSHSNKNVPYVFNFSIHETGSDCLEVNLAVTVTELGGLVYCAAFPSSFSILDIWTILSQSHYSSAPLSSPTAPEQSLGYTNLTICGLFSSLEYSVVCLATDSFNNPTTTLDEILLNKITYLPDYPIATELTPSLTGFALQHPTDYSPETLPFYSIHFSLAYPPRHQSVSVSLNIVKGNTSDNCLECSLSPSSYLISPSFIDDMLTGSFLLSGPPGTYDLSLQITGIDSNKFLPSPSISMEIIDQSLESYLFLPYISSALFDYSGSRILITFSTPTDSGQSILGLTAVLTTWKCNLLFVFDGATEASCLWRNSKTVIVTLNYFHQSSRLILPGGPIELLPDVIKGVCVEKSSSICQSYPYTPTSLIYSSVAKTHVLPQATLLMPSQHLLCQDLIIDPTQSYGHGNRVWKLIQWKVIARSSSSSSLIDVQPLLDHLNAHPSLDTPITIPSALLSPGTYTISLGLLNYMQALTETIEFTSRTIEILSSSSLLTMSLSTPDIVNLEVSSKLFIEASLHPSSCSGQPLDSSFSANYQWSMSKNNLYDPTLSSMSSSTNSGGAPVAAAFLLHGRNLDLKSVYLLTVIINASTTTQQWQLSKQILIFGMQSQIKSMISGGISSLTLNPQSELVLDSFSSQGRDISEMWSCKHLSISNYGMNCFATDVIGGSTLTIPSMTFATNSTYLISLTIVAVSINGILSDSSSITISTYETVNSTTTSDLSIAYLSPTPPYPFNTQEPLHIFTELSSTLSHGAYATWFLKSQANHLQYIDINSTTISLTPISRYLSPSQLSHSASYPFGLYPNFLTPGQQYTFQFVVDASFETGIYRHSVEISIYCNTPPTSGVLTINPNQGDEFSTNFLLSSSLWIADIANYPLSYQYIYQPSGVLDRTEVYYQVNLPSISSYQTTQLPAGKSSSFAVSIGLIVRDIWDSNGFISKSISVFPSPTTTTSSRKLLGEVSVIDSFMATFTEASRVNDLNTMLSSYQQAIQSLVNEVKPNCTKMSPQDCESLHREPCSDVSHTCGSCLSGYHGIYGPSNTLCHLNASPKSHVNEYCETNSDCEYNLCDLEEKTCQYPTKTCPLGQNGEICSGHGQCTFLTPQGAPLTGALDCLINNVNCLPQCVCESDSYGSTCSYSEGLYSQMKSDQEYLCEELKTLSDRIFFTDDRILTQTLLLLTTAESFSSSSSPSSSSSSALDLCAEHLPSLLSDLEVYLTEDKNYNNLMNHHLADLISVFAQSPGILPFVNRFEELVYGNMILGQSPVTFATENYNPLLSYSLSTDLSGIALTLPQTEIEIFYQLPEINLTLPNNLFANCGENFVNEKESKLTLTLWRFSPYLPSSQSQSQQQQEEELISNLISMKLSSLQGSSSSLTPTASSGNSSYDLEIQLNSPFDSTDSSRPLSLEYNFKDQNFTESQVCEVISFSNSYVHLRCLQLFDVCSFNSSMAPSDEGSLRIFALSSTSAVNPFTKTKASSDSINTGVLSFFSVYLFLVLISLVLLFYWDYTDRISLIQMAKAQQQKQDNKIYLLSSAFDNSGASSSIGVQLSQVVSNLYRRSSLGFVNEGTVNKKNSVFATTNPFNRESLITDKGGVLIPQLTIENQIVQQSTAGYSMLGQEGSLDDHHHHGKQQHEEHAQEQQRQEGDYRVNIDMTDYHHQEFFDDPDSLLTWSNLPITSLLSDYSWYDRLCHSISRHHKWIRIFTYPSLRKTRLLRLLVAATDLLVLIFFNTIFYRLFYPDDGSCESNSFTTIDNCHSKQSSFQNEGSLCEWNVNTGECKFKQVPLSVEFIIFVCIIVILLSSLPRSCFQYLLENICSKRPTLEDIGLSSATYLFSEPIAPPPAYVTAGRGDGGGGKMTKGRKKYQKASQMDDENETKNDEQNGETEGDGILSLEEITPTMQLDSMGLTSKVTTDLYQFVSCDHMSVEEEYSLILSEYHDLVKRLNEQSTQQDNDLADELYLILEAQRELLDMSLKNELKPLSWRQQLLFWTPIRHLKWKVSRARQDSMTLARHLFHENSQERVGGATLTSSQMEFRDMSMIQHFILEQISPITRYVVKKDMFQMDGKAPDRISFIPWFSSWLVICCAWIFMSYWVISWCVNYRPTSAQAWGLVLGIVCLADMVIHELSQIYFIHIHMLNKLKPQLRDIFMVLSDILEYRVQQKRPRYAGLRISQHFSASCRLSRSPLVTSHLSASILSLIDDIDIFLCRRNRLVSFQQVGYFSYLTLIHPAILNTTYDLLQQSVMDLILPIFWCCFILLNNALYQVSVYLLIALYLLTVIMVILWQCYSFKYSTSDPSSSSSSPTQQPIREEYQKLNCYNQDGEDKPCSLGELQTHTHHHTSSSPAKRTTALIDMSTVFDNPHATSSAYRGGRHGGGRSSQMTYMSSPLRPQEEEQQQQRGNEIGDPDDQEGDVALVLSDLSMVHGKGKGKGYRGVGTAEEGDYSIASFFDTEMFSQQKFQEGSGVIFKAQEEYTL